MPKASPIQSSFNTGEITPLLYGRPDLENYRNALQTSLNGIPLIQGPWARRPGTYFTAEVKDSSKATRVVPFKFSTTQAYIIEFGNLYVRFYRNNGPIDLTAQNITGITKANPAVVTYSGSDTYANGDMVDISGVVGMTEVNGRRFTVANVNTGANTFELSGVNSTSYTTYVSGGTVSEVYEVTTPYVEADLFQLKFTQSADVLYITHPSYAPRKLTRTAHTSWTLSTISFLDGPYLPTNSTAVTMTPGAATGATTLTASSATFVSTDVGRLVRMKEGSTWGYATITGYTSSTVVNITVVNTLTNTNAKTSWRLGLYSDTTGYPACSTFHEDRLFFGGNTSNPQRIDGSKTGDYENFAPSDTAGTVASDNAVAATLNSDDVQVIRWMKGDEKGLLIGTVEGEWVVRPSSQSEALSPTNITAKQSSDAGSANIQALRAQKGVLFVQKSGRKIREMAYLYEVDGFRSPDMTAFWEHITSGGIKEISFQKEPQAIVWCVRNDGELLGFTYERDQKVLGWHKHELGGYSDSGHTTAAVVESVACIPSADGTRDELWMVVKRYINGGTKRYIEYMTKLWEEGDNQEDAFFVDCGLTYDSTPTTTISGIYHLAGETVSILADGATHPDKTVSATGTITLDRSASVVQVGYMYNSDGQTLRLEAGAADGTSQGKNQRIHRVIFRLHESLGLKVGRDFDNLQVVTFRTGSDLTAQAVPLFSGDKEVSWEGAYSSDNHICWRFYQPLPGTVLAIMPQLVTQDR